MSFGVDVLGTLSEKLRHMFDETQQKYSIFVNASKLYKEQSINEREFFHHITDYIVNLSALNFLAVRVILELKSAIDRGTSIKDTTGGFVSTASTAAPTSQQLSFGIGGFIGTGGKVGIYEDTSQQKSQLPPSLRPVDIEIERSVHTTSQEKRPNGRRCKACGTSISQQAKFCSKCGNLQ